MWGGGWVTTANDRSAPSTVTRHLLYLNFLNWTQICMCKMLNSDMHVQSVTVLLRESAHFSAACSEQTCAYFLCRAWRAHTCCRVRKCTSSPCGGSSATHDLRSCEGMSTRTNANTRTCKTHAHTYKTHETQVRTCKHTRTHTKTHARSHTKHAARTHAVHARTHAKYTGANANTRARMQITRESMQKNTHACKTRETHARTCKHTRSHTKHTRTHANHAQIRGGFTRMRCRHRASLRGR